MPVEFTEEELREFDRITGLTGSLRQMDRIEGRLALRTFVNTHGEAKCDAMFAEIKRREKKQKGFPFG